MRKKKIKFKDAKISSGLGTTRKISFFFLKTSLLKNCYLLVLADVTWFQTL
jgi:hypothetical protein